MRARQAHACCRLSWSGHACACAPHDCSFPFTGAALVTVHLLQIESEFPGILGIKESLIKYVFEPNGAKVGARAIRGRVRARAGGGRVRIPGWRLRTGMEGGASYSAQEGELVRDTEAGPA